jgi:CRP/FNR family transcriptional regulator, nitrogen fixation regulation protein
MASLSITADSRFPAVHAVPPRAAWTAPSSPERRDGGGVAQTGQLLHFAPDAEIYADGSKCASLYRVARGVVRACKFRSDGRRQIDAFYLPGDMFGFEEAAEHRLSAEAVSECSVIAYRWRGLDTLCSFDDRTARLFLSCAVQALGRAQEHSLLLGRRSASQKVAAFLVDMADRGPDGDKINLAMARQDIADYLGLTIETVSRTLSQLERDGIIALPSARRVCVTNRLALRQHSS